VGVDVTNSDQIAELAKATTREFGRIDILVNNAGGNNPLSPAVNMDDKEWDWFIRLNLTSTFLCSKTVGRVMIDQKKGNIVNIASAAGIRAVPGLSPYAAAKAGVINFTGTLSVELARYHIRVNCIIPGAIETGLGAAVRGTAQERVERAGIPWGRVGQPEDIAMAAIYLSSDASDYVTGASIEVKGGPYTRKGDTEMFIAKFPEL
jgi:NAD(P)-dependent dehydrogenase (short-subunit alcohol dehydrogenase family)